MFYVGNAVINAAEMGVSFPLKRRDQLLDYVLTLMGKDESNDFFDSNLELLHTQVCLFIFDVLLLSFSSSFS